MILVTSPLTPSVNTIPACQAAGTVFASAYIDCNVTGNGSTLTAYLTGPVANQQTLMDGIAAGTNATYLALVQAAADLQIFRDYAAPFVNNIRLWVSLGKAMDDNRGPVPANATDILNGLKAQVMSCLTILLDSTKTPAGILTQFNAERGLQGSTTSPLTVAAVNAFTGTAAQLSELRILVQVVKSAVNKGLAIAAVAGNIN